MAGFADDGHMTWPAPDLLAPPTAQPEVTAPCIDHEHREDEEERRYRSGLPAATWIALLGGALVLLAAASVVVANWDAIGRTFRVLGLIAGTGVLVVASERMRQLAPTTSNIVAHVGTFLTATVGIAALSLFGVTWPGCLVAGGLLALAATVWQSERWSPQLFRVAQVGAISLAATGLAELTGTTGGLIAAIAALGLLLIGAERRATALALLAVLSPVLAALADAGIGAGTFERAGLVGERLSWSGPTVGLLAAMVLGIVARRRANNGLMLAAVAAPVLGIVTGLAAIDGSAAAWLSVPAIAVIATELGCWMLPSDRFRTSIVHAADGIAVVLGGLALAAPWAVGEFDLADSATPYPWAVPTGVTAFAMLLATYRWHRGDERLVDLGIPAVLALGLATLVALGVDPLVTATAAVAAVAAGAFASRRLHAAAVHVPAVWALVEIEQLTGHVGSGRWMTGLVLAAATFATVVVARARRAAAEPFPGGVEMSLVVVAGAVTAALFADAGAATAAVVGTAVVGTMVTLVERRWLLLQIAAAALIGLVATDALVGPDGLAGHAWIGWGAVTMGLTAVWATHRSSIAAHAAAASVVVTVTAFVAGRHVAVEDVVAGSMCAVALLTGLALTLQRRTPIDTAAVTAGVVLAVSGVAPVDPTWVSGIWVVLGLQAVAYGTAMRHRLLTTAGAATAALAAASWWFTTGLDEWFRELIAPADITVGDLWAAVTTLVALSVGWALRRTLGVNSWLAYGAGLAIGGIWLIGVQLDRDPVWAVPAALTLGIAAAGLGAWHRLAAPLIGGTVITAITTFMATGSDLAAIPTWSWLAAGGLALLATAVLIERTSKQGTNLHDLVDRWD